MFLFPSKVVSFDYAPRAPPAIARVHVSRYWADLSILLRGKTNGLARNRWYFICLPFSAFHSSLLRFNTERLLTPGSRKTSEHQPLKSDDLQAEQQCWNRAIFTKEEFKWHSVEMKLLWQLSELDGGGGGGESVCSFGFIITGFLHLWEAKCTVDFCPFRSYRGKEVIRLSGTNFQELEWAVEEADFNNVKR